MNDRRASDKDDATLDAARALRRAGRTGEAIGALRTLITARPDFALAHHQLASALFAAGDGAGAETELRAALALDADLPGAATQLAEALTARGRADEALEVLKPYTKGAAATLHVLTTQGVALKALGRLDEAAVAYRRAADASPTSGVAEHNLAGVLGDMHRFAESEAATRRAFAKGLDAPETWLVRGRALRGLREFDEAEAAFRQALRRRATYPDAHADLAQLIWMRTEDLSAARAELDGALAAQPSAGPLSVALADLLDNAGEAEEARTVLTKAIERSADPPLLVSAALRHMRSEPGAALAFAERAVAMAPNAGPPRTALCQAYLALGRADAAAAIAEQLCREWPLDQFPLALAATAWRLMDDPRYRPLYDYDRLVRAFALETPPGWPDLEAWLGDLAARLQMLQQLRGHPVGQSLRNGAQTEQSLALSKDPVIAAFFTVIDAPIRAYIEAIRAFPDVVGQRATHGYRFSGAWSALLRPDGYHIDHLHPLGWISSACHIALPAAINEGRQGWLKFGQPGVPTAPALPAEYFVKPSAGRLVLFPSYMWHGTVPFGGKQPRLTVAFDLIPA